MHELDYRVEDKEWKKINNIKKEAVTWCNKNDIKCAENIWTGKQEKSCD